MTQEESQMTIGEAQTLLQILISDYRARSASIDPEALWVEKMRIIELTKAIDTSVLLSPIVPGWWSEAAKNVQTGRP